MLHSQCFGFGYDDDDDDDGNVYEWAIYLIYKHNGNSDRFFAFSKLINKNGWHQEALCII